MVPSLPYPWFVSSIGDGPCSALTFSDLVKSLSEPETEMQEEGSQPID